jgi:hypothetical protein
LRSTKVCSAASAGSGAAPPSDGAASFAEIEVRLARARIGQLVAAVGIDEQADVLVERAAAAA